MRIEIIWSQTLLACVLIRAELTVFDQWMTLFAYIFVDRVPDFADRAGDIVWTGNTIVEDLITAFTDAIMKYKTRHTDLASLIVSALFAIVHEKSTGFTFFSRVKGKSNLTAGACVGIDAVCTIRKQKGALLANPRTFSESRITQGTSRTTRAF